MPSVDLSIRLAGTRVPTLCRGVGVRVELAHDYAPGNNWRLGEINPGLPAAHRPPHGYLSRPGVLIDPPAFLGPLDGIGGQRIYPRLIERLLYGRMVQQFRGR